MASLFVTRPDMTRPRAVMNGGLGGFVTIGSTIVMETLGHGKVTWPKNRRRRRNKSPPSSIVQESDKYFVKQEIVPPFAENCQQAPRTPRTPVSRYNVLLTPSSGYSNNPLTPKYSSPLELPGSLLLPSQGFPQSDPPCTPARLPAPSRSSSEDSDCIWTPGFSVSSATDIEDDEMPKSFPPKHLLRAAKSGKARDFSAPAFHELTIGKPLSTMSTDELLAELPQLTTEAIKAIWIPAIIKQHDRIKNLLQGAADVRLDTNTEFQGLGQMLQSISQDAHKISHTYERAINSAESLAERDVKACHNQLEIAENNLSDALTTIDNNHQDLRRRDEAIEQLRYTLDEVVRVLGHFIHDHMSTSFLEDFSRDDVREAMQLIEDHSIAPSDETPTRFLRVPEEHYMANIDALREAQLKTDRFREVAISQHRMIAQQSAQLDERLIVYQRSVEIIGERNEEAKLLAKDNQLLREMVREFEIGLRVSTTTKAVQEELFRDQETMQSILKQESASHVIEIQQRDAEIRDLKKQLGSAQEEVLRGKADMKNVITHTQALLSPAEAPEKSDLPALTLKERRMMSKGKGQPIVIPASQSMLSLSTVGQISKGAPSILERRQSANFVARPIDQPAFAMMPRDVTPQWACGVSQRQSDPDLRDPSKFSPIYASRPRMDSLGCSDGQQRPSSGDHTVASAVVNRMLGAPIQFDPNKTLPQRPGLHYALDIYSGKNARSMQEAEDWYSQDQPQQPRPVSPPQMLQRKRVLSQIQEMSVEDSTSERASEKDAASAAESAKEAYHKGLQTVRMHDFINQTNSITQSNGKGEEHEHDDSPDYEGRDYYPLQVSDDDVGLAKNVEIVDSPLKHAQQQYAKVYQNSQDGSNSTLTRKDSPPRSQHPKLYADSQDGSNSTLAKKNSPLREVQGISVLGDPWLSGSPARL